MEITRLRGRACTASSRARSSSKLCSGSSRCTRLWMAESFARDEARTPAPGAARTSATMDTRVAPRATWKLSERLHHPARHVAARR